MLNSDKRFIYYVIMEILCSWTDSSNGRIIGE